MEWLNWNIGNTTGQVRNILPTWSGLNFRLKIFVRFGSSSSQVSLTLLCCKARVWKSGML